jgi:hypothetical protein
VTPPDLDARSRALLTARRLGALAVVAVASMLMVGRRGHRAPAPLVTHRPSPTEPDLDARRGARLTACGLGALAVVAVASMLVVGLRDYRAPVPLVTHRPSPTATVIAQEPEQSKRSDNRNESGPRRLFAATSVWNRRLPTATPIDPASAVLVAGFQAEVNRELEAGIGPGIATRSDSTPLYEVESGQRRAHVRLDAKEAPMLKRALASVPIPDGAKPADGPDRHMTIWQPSTDRLWELSGARRRADGWHAAWGGAFRRVSRSRGYYDSVAWPGATPYWGATGSSLPVIGGTILIDDLRRMRIDHALAISLPAPRAGAFAWPAQRTDGTGPLAALPEGARLRLDPQLDLRSLELPRLVRMIAWAAKHHGLIVRDRTDDRGISFFAEDPAPLGRNPYRKYLSGRSPSELLARFPWDRLQVLEMHLCWTAPCSRR